ncbi:MAG: hypothetical protein CMJ05_10790 [Pelagibacterales bacterium]|nr:hypothetical protein [Pelagibacterales bacterium]
MNFLKKILKNKRISIAYSKIYYIIDRIKIELFLFLKKLKGFSILTKSNCKETINTKKRVCHIIGSGESLNKTKSLIKENDFVIGFNFSALAEINFDLYMIEFYGEKCKNISDKQLKVVEEFLDPSTTILLKHSLHKRNDFNYIRKNYINKELLILKDVLIRCLSIDSHKYICKKFLLKTETFNQFSSSVIVALDIAFKLEFDKIILHGVDLEGPYFFQKNNYLKEFYPFDSINYKKIENKRSHQVNEGEFSLERTLNYLSLSNDFKRIFTGSKNKKLSNLFDSYE